MSDEKVYILFKGNPAELNFVGAYSNPEHALSMALHIMRSGIVSTIKLDAYQLNVPIPIVMPRTLPRTRKS